MTSAPLTELNLERVAQLGGSINGITIQRDIAYVGMGPRVAAIDISQHEHPRLIGKSDPLSGLVTQLLQISEEPNQLLLVNAGKYVEIIDTSNMNKINAIRQLELPGSINTMVWDAGRSILSAGGSIFQPSQSYSGYVSTIHVSPDNQLTLISTVTIPDRLLRLAMGESYLYAGVEGEQGGLYFIQLNTFGELTPPRLVIASTPENPLHPLRMQVIGERLYLSYRSIEGYDITKPDQPAKIWTGYTGGNVVDDFSLIGNQIYYFGWTILSEFVEGAISAPEPIDGLPVGEIASVTTIHNGAFLVAFNDLEIYDTANTEDLKLIGKYQTYITNAMAAVANENRVFVVDTGIGDGLSNAVLRVLSLRNLEPVGQVTTEFLNGYGQGYRGIALDGDRLYLASENSVWIYAVSSSEPTLQAKLELTDGRVDTITAMTVGKKRLLVTAQQVHYFSSLAVYDMTDIKNPMKLGTPLKADRGSVIQMIWDGSTLYALQDTSYHADVDRLFILRLENDALTVRETLELDKHITAIAVSKDTLAILSTKGVSIFSAVKDEPFKLMAQTTLPEIGEGVAIINSVLLVATGQEYGAAQLLPFDIQDLMYPSQLMAADIAVSNNHFVPILVTNSYVILANGAGGVEMLSFEG